MNALNMITKKFLTREELEDICREFSDAIQKVSFKNSDVPGSLHPLVPYAEIWGISDDWAREELVEKTPEPIKENLRWAIAQFDDELDAWLAGPEASEAYPSDAYIAFSSLRMAVDFI